MDNSKGKPVEVVQKLYNTRDLNLMLDSTSNIKDIRVSRKFGRVDYGYLSIIEYLNNTPHVGEDIVFNFNKETSDEKFSTYLINVMSKELASYLSRMNVYNRSYEIGRTVNTIKTDSGSLHCRTRVLVKGYDSDCGEEGTTESILNFTFSVPLEDIEEIENSVKGA